jgi:hypothetical protein
VNQRAAQGISDLLPLLEAAAATGRNPELLRRWCASGRIHCRRVGPTWAIERSELEQIVAMPKRGRRTRPDEIDVADLGVLPDALRREVQDCLESGEGVRVVVPGTEDAALIATQQRVFLARDGVLVRDPQGRQVVAWPLGQLRRVQLEVGAGSGALVITPQNPDDRALVIVLARPHLARAEAASNALRGLLEAAGSYE